MVSFNSIDPNTSSNMITLSACVWPSVTGKMLSTFKKMCLNLFDKVCLSCTHNWNYDIKAMSLGMRSECHYTTLALTYGDMPSSAAFVVCIIAFWTHAQGFSLILRVVNQQTGIALIMVFIFCKLHDINFNQRITYGEGLFSIRLPKLVAPCPLFSWH